jgi:hypothetical protein
MPVKTYVMTDRDYSMILSRIGVKCYRCRREIGVGDRYKMITDDRILRPYHAKCHEAAIQ